MNTLLPKRQNRPLCAAFRVFIEDLKPGEMKQIPFAAYPPRTTAYKICIALGFRCAHVRVERINKVYVIRTS